MICRETKANLTNLLLDGESAPAEVRKHVEQCAECKRELAELEATMRLLDGWETPELTPSPFFDARMSARLRLERDAPPSNWMARMRQRLLFGTNMHLRPIAAGALVLLLLIGGGTYVGFVNLHQPPANTSATVRDLQSLDDNSQVFQQLNTLDQQDDDSDGGSGNSNL